MREIHIGLIGAGFMGGAHSTAYTNVPIIFEDVVKPRLYVVADVNEANAKRLCSKYGFKRWTTDWREVTSDPSIDLVDITTPNSTHVEILLEAAKNKKHIYCEKPLAMDAAEAKKASAAVEKAGVMSFVGFNYIHNPIQNYVKSIIDSDELGKVISFRGTFDQDYYAEDDTLHTWRFLKKVSASGALGDLASHTISLAEYLVGDIREVCGMTEIIVNERPDQADTSHMLPVENDDFVQFMFRYGNGASGVIMSNRLAAGRKMALCYEIQLTRGCIVYTQERQNEVQIYRHDDKKTERGFKTVLIAPGHGEYERFYGGAGIGLGYSDQKTIEAYRVLKGIADNRKGKIDVDFGCRVNMVIDAVLKSAETLSWVVVE
jgi:predicted dehydrogenase